MSHIQIACVSGEDQHSISYHICVLYLSLVFLLKTSMGYLCTNEKEDLHRVESSPFLLSCKCKEEVPLKCFLRTAILSDWPQRGFFLNSTILNSSSVYHYPFSIFTSLICIINLIHHEHFNSNSLPWITLELCFMAKEIDFFDGFN